VITDRRLIGEIARSVSRQPWVGSARLLVVLCTRCVPDARGGRDIQRFRYPEHETAIAVMDQSLYWALNQEEHQTKIPGTVMAMVALEHGIGSCWVSRFHVARLSSLLSLPADCMAGEMIAFGYPAREGKRRPKKPVREVVFYDTYAGGEPAMGDG